MGVDYFNCNLCQEIVNDYNKSHCGGCEEVICDSCANDMETKYGTKHTQWHEYNKNCNCEKLRDQYEKEHPEDEWQEKYVEPLCDYGGVWSCTECNKDEIAKRKASAEKRFEDLVKEFRKQFKIKSIDKAKEMVKWIENKCECNI